MSKADPWFVWRGRMLIPLSVVAFVLSAATRLRGMWEGALLLLPPRRRP